MTPPACTSNQRWSLFRSSKHWRLN